MNKINLEKLLENLLNNGINKNEIIKALNDQGFDFVDGKIVEIKPKFKVGDVITVDGRVSYRVESESLIKGIYKSSLINLNHDCSLHISPIKLIDDIYRLWTIKDAQEGDILKVRNWIFVYAGITKFSAIKYHAILNIDTNCCDVNTSTGIGYADDENNKSIRLAYPEEQKLILYKIRELGYIWNPNEKIFEKFSPYISKIDFEKIDGNEITINGLTNKQVDLIEDFINTL